jgi:hypothetical protein
MLRSLHPFVSTLLSIVVAVFFVVMTTAFISIPHSLGGHPGEVAVAPAVVPEYHPA